MHAKTPWLSRFALLATPYLLTMLVGCGGPELRPLPPDATILAYGDSLTHGTGVPEGRGYPGALAELTGLEVINAGIPGELTAEGLERLPRVLQAHDPDLVVLVHGGNDLMQRRSGAQARRNVAAMLEMIRASGSQAVMLGVPGPSLTLSAPSWYAEVAEAAQVPVDTEVLPRLIRDPAMKSDRVHLNEQGYRRMAEAVAELLREAGALP